MPPDDEPDPLFDPAPGLADEPYEPRVSIPVARKRPVLRPEDAFDYSTARVDPLALDPKQFPQFAEDRRRALATQEHVARVEEVDAHNQDRQALLKQAWDSRKRDERAAQAKKEANAAIREKYRTYGVSHVTDEATGLYKPDRNPDGSIRFRAQKGKEIIDPDSGDVYRDDITETGMVRTWVDADVEPAQDPKRPWMVIRPDKHSAPNDIGHALDLLDHKDPKIRETAEKVKGDLDARLMGAVTGDKGLFARREATVALEEREFDERLSDLRDDIIATRGDDEAQAKAVQAHNDFIESKVGEIEPTGEVVFDMPKSFWADRKAAIKKEKDQWKALVLIDGIEGAEAKFKEPERDQGDQHHPRPESSTTVKEVLAEKRAELGLDREAGRRRALAAAGQADPEWRAIDEKKIELEIEEEDFKAEIKEMEQAAKARLAPFEDKLRAMDHEMQILDAPISAAMDAAESLLGISAGGDTIGNRTARISAKMASTDWETARAASTILKAVEDNGARWNLLSEQRNPLIEDYNAQKEEAIAKINAEIEARNEGFLARKEAINAEIREVSGRKMLADMVGGTREDMKKMAALPIGESAKKFLPEIAAIDADTEAQMKPLAAMPLGAERDAMIKEVSKKRDEQLKEVYAKIDADAGARREFLQSLPDLADKMLERLHANEGERLGDGREIVAGEMLRLRKRRGKFRQMFEQEVVAAGKEAGYSKKESEDMLSDFIKLEFGEGDVSKKVGGYGKMERKDRWKWAALVGAPGGKTGGKDAWRWMLSLDSKAPAEPAVVLSSGAVWANPALTFVPDAAEAAIEAADATPEAKENALLRLEELRSTREMSGPIFQAILSAEGKPVDATSAGLGIVGAPDIRPTVGDHFRVFVDNHKYSDTAYSGANQGEVIIDYARENPKVWRALSAEKLKQMLAVQIPAFVSMALGENIIPGVLGMAPGSFGQAEKSRSAGENARRQIEEISLAQQSLGGGTAFWGLTKGDWVEGAGSVLPYLAGGTMAKSFARAMKLSQAGTKVTTIAGTAATAGSQSAAPTYFEAAHMLKSQYIAESLGGRDPSGVQKEEMERIDGRATRRAQETAFNLSVVAGGITALTTSLIAPTKGIEAMLHRDPSALGFLGRMKASEVPWKQYIVSEEFRTGLREGMRSMAIHASAEAVEEFTDELLQGYLALGKAHSLLGIKGLPQYDPNMTNEQVWDNALKAGKLGAVLGAGMNIVGSMGGTIEEATSSVAKLQAKEMMNAVNDLAAMNRYYAEGSPAVDALAEVSEDAVALGARRTDTLKDELDEAQVRIGEAEEALEAGEGGGDVEMRALVENLLNAHKERDALIKDAGGRNKMIEEIVFGIDLLGDNLAERRGGKPVNPDTLAHTQMVLRAMTKLATGARKKVTPEEWEALATKLEPETGKPVKLTVPRVEFYDAESGNYSQGAKGKGLPVFTDKARATAIEMVPEMEGLMGRTRDQFTDQLDAEFAESQMAAENEGDTTEAADDTEGAADDTEADGDETDSKPADEKSATYSDEVRTKMIEALTGRDKNKLSPEDAAAFIDAHEKYTKGVAGAEDAADLVTGDYDVEAVRKEVMAAGAKPDEKPKTKKPEKSKEEQRIRAELEANKAALSDPEVSLDDRNALKKERQRLKDELDTITPELPPPPGKEDASKPKTEKPKPEPKPKAGDPTVMTDEILAEREAMLDALGVRVMDYADERISERVSDMEMERAKGSPMFYSNGVLVMNREVIQGGGYLRKSWIAAKKRKVLNAAIDEEIKHAIDQRVIGTKQFRDFFEAFAAVHPEAAADLREVYFGAFEESEATAESESEQQERAGAELYRMVRQYLDTGTTTEMELYKGYEAGEKIRGAMEEFVGSVEGSKRTLTLIEKVIAYIKGLVGGKKGESLTAQSIDTLNELLELGIAEQAKLQAQIDAAEQEAENFGNGVEVGDGKKEPVGAEAVTKPAEDGGGKPLDEPTTAEQALDNYIGTLDLTPMKEGALRKALAKEVGRRDDGRVYSGSRDTVMRQMIGQEWEPAVEDVPAMKEASREAYNRMSNKEQEDYENRRAEAGTKKEYSIEKDDTSFVITKSEYDYGVFLRNLFKRPENDNQPNPVPARKPADAPPSPEAAPVDEATEVPADTKAAEDELGSGLFAAPSNKESYTEAIPDEKFDALSKVTRLWIRDGMDTPQKLAARLYEKWGDKAQPYSESIWRMFGVLRPELGSAPGSIDWGAMYEALDQLKEWRADMGEASRKAKANYDKAVEAAGDAKGVRMGNSKAFPDMEVLITPDPGEKGKWRAARIDALGPQGHTVWDTRNQAIADYTGGHGNAMPPWSHDFEVIEALGSAKDAKPEAETIDPPLVGGTKYDMGDGRQVEFTGRVTETGHHEFAELTKAGKRKKRAKVDVLFEIPAHQVAQLLDNQPAAESPYPKPGDKHYNAQSDALAKSQEIEQAEWKVGNDVHSTIEGGDIRRIVRLTKDLGGGKFEATLSPRSHQYPEFVGKTFTVAKPSTSGNVPEFGKSLRPNSSEVDTPAEAAAEIEEEIDEQMDETGGDPVKIKRVLTERLQKELANLPAVPDLDLKSDDVKTVGGRRQFHIGTTRKGGRNFLVRESKSETWVVYDGVIENKKKTLGNLIEGDLGQAKKLARVAVENHLAPNKTSDEHRAKTITIKIPGDGTFTVMRNRHALGELLRRVKAMSAKPKATTPGGAKSKASVKEVAAGAFDGRFSQAEEVVRQWIEQAQSGDEFAAAVVAAMEEGASKDQKAIIAAARKAAPELEKGHKVGTLIAEETLPTGEVYEYGIISDKTGTYGPGTRYSVGIRTKGTDKDFEPGTGAGWNINAEATVENLARKNAHNTDRFKALHQGFKNAIDKFSNDKAAKEKAAKEKEAAEKAERKAVNEKKYAYEAEVAKTKVKFKKGNVEITAADGETKIKLEGTRLGDWFISKEPKSGRDQGQWKVTHVPSGKAMPRFTTATDARNLVKKLVHGGISVTAALDTESKPYQKMLETVKAHLEGRAPDWFATEPEAAAEPEAEPEPEPSNPLAAYAAEWLAMTPVKQGQAMMAQKVLRLAKEQSQAEVQSVIDSVTEQGEKYPDGGLTHNSPHAEIAHELLTTLRWMESKDIGNAPAKPAKPAAEAKPTAKDAGEAIKKAYPFATVKSGSDEKKFIAKAKANLKPLGVAGWKVDSAVDSIKKGRRSASGMIRYVHDTDLIAELVRAGDVLPAEAKGEDIPILPARSAEVVAQAEVARIIGDLNAQALGEGARNATGYGEVENPGQLEKIKKLAGEQGFAWPDVLDKVREQLGLTADFVKPGSAEEGIIKMRRKEAAPKKPTKKNPTDDKKIEDFGEKIGGARKDTWAKRGFDTGDFDTLGDSEQQAYSMKPQVFPRPKYDEYAEAMGRDLAWLVKGVYDAITPKPRLSAAEAADPEKRKAALRQYVETVGELRERLPKVRAFEDLAKIRDEMFPKEEDSRYARLTEEARRKIERVSSTSGRNLKLWAKLSARSYDLSKAQRKLEDDPWPAKQEAWQKRFKIHKIPAGAKDFKNGEQVTLDADEYFVTKKNGRQMLVTDLATEEEAIAWAKEQVKGKSGPLMRRPYKDDSRRDGPDYRKGKDITPDQFLETFGFRGGEFGNWENESDRQQSLNQTFDAFHDMARVMGVPPEAMSLNGELSIAWGARGSGGAAAHYEPARVVINMTKTSGAGSLAHEWAHAVDDYFGRMATGGQARRYLSDHGAKKNVRPEVIAAWANIMSTISTRNETPAEVKGRVEEHLANSKKRVDNWTRAQANNNTDLSWKKEEADRLRELESIFAGETGFAGDLKEAATEYIGIYTEAAKRGKKKARYAGNSPAATASSIAAHAGGVIAFRDALAKIEAGDVATEKPIETKTDLLRASEEKGDYWKRRHELFARSFESWVQDKVAEEGNQSDYLVHSTKGGGEWGAVYPQGNERVEIKKAFQSWSDTLKTKKTDRGVALYAAPLNQDELGFYSKAEAMVKQKLPAEITAVEAVNVPEKRVKLAKSYVRDGKTVTHKTIPAKSYPAMTVSEFVMTEMRKASVKESELKWLGLEPWLEGKDKVTKAEVLEFLAANKLQLREVAKGEPTEEQIQALDENAIEEMMREELPRDAAIKYLLDYENGLQYTGPDATTGDYTQPGGTNPREFLLTIPPDDAKLHGWIETYEDSDEVNGTVWRARFAEGAPVSGGIDVVARTEADVRDKAFAGLQRQYQQEGYRSGHFSDTPNIVVWVRTKDRTTSDGKLVLHIEEIQSDWAGDINKDGARDEAEITQLKAQRAVVQKDADRLANELAGIGEHPERNVTSGTVWEAISKEHAAAANKVRDLTTKIQAAESAPPPMPFAKTYHEVALKRMLRRAADEGYDLLTWSTGAQQIDLYSENLRQNVSAIEWHRRELPMGGKIEALPNGRFRLTSPGGTFSVHKTRAEAIEDAGNWGSGNEPTSGGWVQVSALKGEDETKFHGVIPLWGEARTGDLRGKTLNDLVGKNIADQIRNSPDISGTIEGDNLSIGGHFHKMMYDTAVPSFLKKFTQRWGGKVGTAKVDTHPSGVNEWGDEITAHGGRDSLSVHALPITPEMREGVQQGSALFAAPRAGVPAVTEADLQPEHRRLLRGESDDTRDGGTDGSLPEGVSYMLTDGAAESHDGIYSNFFEPHEELENIGGEDTWMWRVDKGKEQATLLGGIPKAIAGGKIAPSKLYGPAPDSDAQTPAQAGEVPSKDPFGNEFKGSAEPILIYGRGKGNYRFIRPVDIHKAVPDDLTPGSSNYKSLFAAPANNQQFTVPASQLAPGESILVNGELRTVLGADGDQIKLGDGTVIDSDHALALRPSPLDPISEGSLVQLPEGQWGRVVAMNPVKILADGVGVIPGNMKTLSPYGGALMASPNRMTHPPSDKTKAKIRQVLGKAGDGKGAMARVSEWFKDHRGSMFEDTAEWIGKNLAYGLFDSAAAVGHIEKRENSGELLQGAESASKTMRLTRNLASVMHFVVGDIHGAGGQLEFVDGWFRPIGFSMKGDRVFKSKHAPPGLQKILSPIMGDEETTDAWSAYMHARRSLELWDQFNADGTRKVKDYTSKQEIRDILAELGKNIEFKVVAQQYAAFNKRLLDLMEAAGVINAEGRASWESAAYVPFYRLMGEEGDKKKIRGGSTKEGIADQRSGIRALHGSELKVDIIANIYRNTAAMLDISFKNAAMRKVTALAVQHGAMVAVPMQAVPFNAAREEAIKKLEQQGYLVEHMTDDELQSHITFFRMKPPPGDDIVSVMLAGKPKYYRVEDSNLLRAVQNMRPQELNKFIQASQAVKRFKTKAITIAPAFLIANFVRDTLSSYVVASDLGIKLADLVSAAGETVRNGPTLELIQAVGGGSGTFNKLREKDVERHFRKAIEKGEDSFHRSLVSGRSILDFWNGVGRGSENTNRVAAAIATARTTRDFTEAGFQAMDMLDFAATPGWKLPRYLSQVSEFFNARSQGAYRLGRGYDANRSKFAIRGIQLAAATAMYTLMHRDDERYWDLDDWDRDLYWHFWTSGAPGAMHIRIPKPFEVGSAFSTSVERLAEQLWGNPDDGVKALGDSFMFALTQVMEVDPTNFLGAAAHPVFELWGNHDAFRDRQIIYEYEKQRKRPEREYGAYTSETAKKFAQAMGDVTPEWLEGWNRWTRSPKQLSFLTNAYFASYGRWIEQGGDAALRMAGAAPQSPARIVDQVPVVGDVSRRFFPDDSTRNNRYVSRAFEDAAELSGTLSAIKEARAEGDREGAREMVEKDRELLQRQVPLRGAVSRMRKISAARNTMLKDDSMTQAQKRKRAQELQEMYNRAARSSRKISH